MARFAILMAVMLAGCHTVPPGFGLGGSMTPEAEALAGALAAPALEHRHGGIIPDGNAERRMTRIGRRLADGTPALEARYHYRLLGAEKMNAFSLPGGRVYLTRGLYRELVTDELLAAVLAHEMAHIASKDHFKPRCDSPGKCLDREVSADARAVVYLRAAGISPEALIGVIRIIEDVQAQGWANTRAALIAASMDTNDFMAWGPKTRP